MSLNSRGFDCTQDDNLVSSARELSFGKSQTSTVMKYFLVKFHIKYISDYILERQPGIVKGGLEFEGINLIFGYIASYL